MRNTPAQRQYVNGEIFPYKGKRLELAVVNGMHVPAENVTTEDGFLWVNAMAPERVRQLILYWYTAETESIVRKLVPEWSKKLAVRPRAVTVKYALTRWGSCSTSGKIFLNSRLAMLSGEVGEYVVVHELCHLKHMNHAKGFKDEVASVLPDWKERRKAHRDQALILRACGWL